MEKLNCHCGQIEIEVNLTKGLEDLYRCNCSMCKRKGAISTVIDKILITLLLLLPSNLFYELQYLLLPSFYTLNNCIYKDLLSLWLSPSISI